MQGGQEGGGMGEQRVRLVLQSAGFKLGGVDQGISSVAIHGGRQVTSARQFLKDGGKESCPAKGDQSG